MKKKKKEAQNTSMLQNVERGRKMNYCETQSNFDIIRADNAAEDLHFDFQQNEHSALAAY